MRIEQPWYNHNGGQIEFGPDGYLYIGSGDGGWEGDPYEAGQDLSTWLGKILRIDVDVAEDADRPYAIPADNPFANASDERLMVLFGITEEEFATIKTRSRPEIWAYGVRNPYEFAFDPATGDLFIADVGQNHWEEIIYQPAGERAAARTTAGRAWRPPSAIRCSATRPSRNARCRRAAGGGIPAPGAVARRGRAHRRTGAARRRAWASPTTAAWRASILVGDWCSGRVFGLGWDGTDWQLEELAQTDLQFTAGGYDEDGNVLAVNCNCFYIGEQGRSPTRRARSGGSCRRTRCRRVPRSRARSSSAADGPRPAPPDPLRGPAGSLAAATDAAERQDARCIARRPVAGRLRSVAAGWRRSARAPGPAHAERHPAPRSVDQRAARARPAPRADDHAGGRAVP